MASYIALALLVFATSPDSGTIFLTTVSIFGVENDAKTSSVSGTIEPDFAIDDAGPRMTKQLAVDTYCHLQDLSEKVGMSLRWLKFLRFFHGHFCSFRELFRLSRDGGF
jgi:hypothetical protein